MQRLIPSSIPMHDAHTSPILQGQQLFKVAEMGQKKQRRITNMGAFGL